LSFRVAEAAIEVSPEEVAARSHTFTVDPPGAGDAADLGARMTAGALLSAWSSAQLAPSVRLLDRGEGGLRFEITVYPVDPAFASKVEGAVRASVDPYSDHGKP